MDSGMRAGWGALACLAVLAGGQARAEAQLSSRLRLALEERYDDGTLLSLGPAGGSQLMTRVRPELSVALKGHTFEVQGSYSPNLLLHHGSGTVTLDHLVDLELGKRLSRLLRVGAGAEMWRVSDPTSLPRTGMARIQRPVLYGRAGAWAELALSRRWRLRGSYGYEQARIEERGWAPSLMHQPGVELSYLLSRRATLGLEYRAQAFQFGHEAATAHHVGALAGYRLTRTLRLDAHAGPVWYRTGDGTDGLAPRLVLDLTKQARRFTGSLSLGHDLVGASGFDTALWADLASASAAWRLTRTLRFNAAASYFRNGRAPAMGMLPGRGEGLLTQGYAVQAELDLQLHRSLSLRGTVSRLQQTGAPGAIAVGGMTHNIVSVRAVLTAWE